MTAAWTGTKSRSPRIRTRRRRCSTTSRCCGTRSTRRRTGARRGRRSGGRRRPSRLPCPICIDFVVLRVFGGCSVLVVFWIPARGGDDKNLVYGLGEAQESCPRRLCTPPRSPVQVSWAVQSLLDARPSSRGSRASPSLRYAVFLIAAPLSPVDRGRNFAAERTDRLRTTRARQPGTWPTCCCSARLTSSS